MSNKAAGLAGVLAGFAIALHVVSAADGPVRPFVFAHYMHCYVLGGIPGNDPRVLDTAQISHLQSWPPLSQESEWFTQELSAIAASGKPAVEIDFDMAEKAGINAFGLLLGPRMIPSSAYSDALDLVASTAQERTVKVIPEIWGDAWKDDYREFGLHTKEFLDRHPGAFQSWQGKPAFVFAFQYSSSHNTPEAQEYARRQVAAFLTPWGGMSAVYWIAYLPYEYDVAAASPLVRSANAVDVWTPQDDWSALHSAVAPQVAAGIGKGLVWPVAPAFYQRRAGSKPWEYGNSLGAARYIDAWLAALKYRPDFIDIQTWNDFSEDSAITSTNTSGDVWLHLTSYLLKWVKSGQRPQLEEERVMLFRPKQLAGASLADPTAVVTNASWRHKTPTVDYLDCVTLLNEPAHLILQSGEHQWEQDVPAGLHEQLIYDPQSVKARPGETVADNASFPISSPLRHVATTYRFGEGQPEARLLRNGNVVISVRSRIPFLAAGEFQDFTIIGDEAERVWRP